MTHTPFQSLLSQASSWKTSPTRGLYIFLAVFCFLVLLTLPIPALTKLSVPLRVGVGVLGLLCFVCHPELRTACTRNVPLGFFLLYLLFAALSLIINHFPPDGTRALTLMTCVFTGYLIFALHFPRLRLVPLILSGSVLALMAFFYLTCGEGMGFTPSSLWPSSRFSGYPGWHPATFGWLCCVSAVLACCTGLHATGRLRWLLVLQTLSLSYLLFLSGARAYMLIGYVLCFAQVILFCKNANNSQRLIAFLVVALFLGSLACNLTTFTDEGPMVEMRDDMTQNNTLQSRTYIWNAAWSAFKERPILGHGTNSTPLYFKTFTLPLRKEQNQARNLETRATQAHNYVLHFLAEGGLVGLLTMTLFLGACLMAAKPSPPLFWAILALLGTSVLDLFMAAREHTTLSFAILACAASLVPVPKHRFSL